MMFSMLRQIDACKQFYLIFEILFLRDRNISEGLETADIYV
jgi:hypothetical protein